MPCTEQEIAAIRLQNQRHQIAVNELEIELRSILNAPRYNLLDNEDKAMLLLELENGGEYDPLG